MSVPYQWIVFASVTLPFQSSGLNGWSFQIFNKNYSTVSHIRDLRSGVVLDGIDSGSSPPFLL